MTKTSIICIAGILFFAACTNDNSSTAGSYENEETSAPSETNEGAAKDEPVINDTKSAAQSATDTAKLSRGAAGIEHAGDSIDQTGRKALKAGGKQ